MADRRGKNKDILGGSMVEEISRVVKKIYTYKDLCDLLHVVSEYRGFNIVDIAGIIAETNKFFL